MSNEQNDPAGSSNVIIPDPPATTEGGAVVTFVDLGAKVAELEAQLAGADQARAAAQLERDAARKAADVLQAEHDELVTKLRQPCRACGTQHADSP